MFSNDQSSSWSNSPPPVSSFAPNRFSHQAKSRFQFLQQPFRGKQTTAPKLACKLVNDEIETLLHKGAIKPVPLNDQAFDRMFLVTKKSGAQRPVLDLSSLNKFFLTEHFKMENLMTIKSLINKEDYMINTDFTDAYLTVPIQFLCFLWQGQSHQIVTMPFCLNMGPRVFSQRHNCARSNIRHIKQTRTYDNKSTRVIRVPT